MRSLDGAYGGRMASKPVEGAGGIGRLLAPELLTADKQVVDDPPKLSSRVRVLSTGNARKNDRRLDATFIDFSDDAQAGTLVGR